MSGGDVGKARSIGHFYRLRASRSWQSAITASTRPHRSTAVSYSAESPARHVDTGNRAPGASRGCSAPCLCSTRRDRPPQVGAFRVLRRWTTRSDTSPLPADGEIAFDGEGTRRFGPAAHGKMVSSACGRGICKRLPVANASLSTRSGRYASHALLQLTEPLRDGNRWLSRRPLRSGRDQSASTAATVFDSSISCLRAQAAVTSSSCNGGASAERRFRVRNALMPKSIGRDTARHFGAFSCSRYGLP